MSQRHVTAEGRVLGGDGHASEHRRGDAVASFLVDHGAADIHASAVLAKHAWAERVFSERHWKSLVQQAAWTRAREYLVAYVPLTSEGMTNDVSSLYRQLITLLDDTDFRQALSSDGARKDRPALEAFNRLVDDFGGGDTNPMLRPYFRALRGAHALDKLPWMPWDALSPAHPPTGDALVQCAVDLFDRLLPMLPPSFQEAAARSGSSSLEEQAGARALTEQVAALQAESSTLRVRAEAAEAESSTLRVRAEAAEAESSTLRVRAEAAEAESTALQVRAEAAEAESSALRARVEAAASEAAASEAAALRVRVESAESKAATALRAPVEAPAAATLPATSSYQPPPLAAASDAILNAARADAIASRKHGSRKRQRRAGMGSASMPAGSAPPVGDTAEIAVVEPIHWAATRPEHLDELAVSTSGASAAGAATVRRGYQPVQLDFCMYPHGDRHGDRHGEEGAELLVLQASARWLKLSVPLAGRATAEGGAGGSTARASGDAGGGTGGVGGVGGAPPPTLLAVVELLPPLAWDLTGGDLTGGESWEFASSSAAAAESMACRSCHAHAPPPSVHIIGAGGSRGRASGKKPAGGGKGAPAAKPSRPVLLCTGHTGVEAKTPFHPSPELAADLRQFRHKVTEAKEVQRAEGVAVHPEDRNLLAVRCGAEDGCGPKLVMIHTSLTQCQSVYYGPDEETSPHVEFALSGDFVLVATCTGLFAYPVHAESLDARVTASRRVASTERARLSKDEKQRASHEWVAAANAAERGKNLIDESNLVDRCYDDGEGQPSKLVVTTVTRPSFLLEPAARPSLTLLRVGRAFCFGSATNNTCTYTYTYARPCLTPLLATRHPCPSLTGVLRQVGGCDALLLVREASVQLWRLSEGKWCLSAYLSAHDLDVGGLATACFVASSASGASPNPNPNPNLKPNPNPTPLLAS